MEQVIQERMRYIAIQVFKGLSWLAATTAPSLLSISDQHSESHPGDKVNPFQVPWTVELSQFSFL